MIFSSHSELKYVLSLAVREVSGSIPDQGRHKNLGRLRVLSDFVSFCRAVKKTAVPRT